MWPSPNRLWAAGALLALAGALCAAQVPPPAEPEMPPVLPAPKVLPAPANPYPAPNREWTEANPAAKDPTAVPAAGDPGCPAGGPGVAGPSGAEHPKWFTHGGPYPELGAMMHQHFQIHVNNGVAARMILYDFDFACGTDKLNVHGLDRLHRLTRLLGSYPYPLVVERTPYAPGLAEARRLVVVNLLAEHGIPIPPERVVIGPSLALPLRGVEAEIINYNLMLQTRNRGIVLGTGITGSTTGAGGGGSGSGTGTSGSGTGGTGGAAGSGFDTGGMAPR
jgi:hypothetical protein